MVQQGVTVKLQCTFADCYVTVEGHGADNEEATKKAQTKLKKHKRSDAYHDYCKTCDLDFECWDDFVEHKAASSDKLHISCPWCGHDFGSHSGRNAHIAQNHPKQQNIDCAACGECFARTAAYVYHLEKGLCSGITTTEFMGHVRHKQFTYTSLQSPRSGKGIDENELQRKAAEDADVGGGVFLDLQCDKAFGLQVPLEPEKKALKVGPNVVEDFPALGGKPASQLGKRSGADQSSSTENAAGYVVADDWETKLAKNSLRDLENGRHDETLDSDPTPAEAASGKTKMTAWFTGNQIAKTFQAGRTTGTLTNLNKGMQGMTYEEKLARKEGVDKQGNMMYDISIADPDHPAFNSSRRYNHITEVYDCPWYECPKTFESVPELKGHLRDGHEASNSRCPVCQKKFDTIYALVAHCEAVNSRCYVKDSRDYGSFLNRITGGFVNAVPKTRDDVEFKQTVTDPLGDEKTETVGLGYIEYTAQLPPEFQASKEDGKPRYTQVTGAQIGWVPPHLRNRR